ncbi:hypothetical protein HJG60_010577 [Phyllostomus discolor]|uniref:Uncharacterized protein n=1 Tax=Phyllostomus discolor TaxID=89673 RepID=A0A834AHM0_9CHIR|nr:hypothetical protein HJG60_010577 [Phyllostomus discolor]
MLSPIPAYAEVCMAPNPAPWLWVALGRLSGSQGVEGRVGGHRSPGERNPGSCQGSSGDLCGQCQGGAPTVRFLGHHPGSPTGSQAFGVGCNEGRSASQIQALLPPLSGTKGLAPTRRSHPWWGLGEALVSPYGAPAEGLIVGPEFPLGLWACWPACPACPGGGVCKGRDAELLAHSS